MTNPYFVVEIENNPATTEFDSYFFGANFTSEAMNFIESALDALEIGDEPVTITVTLVGLNEKQVEFIAEYGREGFDKIELEMLADEPSDEEGERFTVHSDIERQDDKWIPEVQE